MVGVFGVVAVPGFSVPLGSGVTGARVGAGSGTAGKVVAPPCSASTAPLVGTSAGPLKENKAPATSTECKNVMSPSFVWSAWGRPPGQDGDRPSRHHPLPSLDRLAT